MTNLVTNMATITQEEFEKLHKTFIEQFPLESLKNLPLEKYSNLNRSDSFCYWLESVAHELGSIWGGSSYKFGIYRYDKKPTSEAYDEHYAWYKRLGDNSFDVYSIVRQNLYDIAFAASIGDYNTVENTKEVFGDVCKWKIAFIYSNMSLIPIYSKEMLQIICKEKGMENVNSASILQMQNFLKQEQSGKHVFEYTNELFQIWNEKMDAPKVWMLQGDDTTFETSLVSMGKTVSSELRDYSVFTTKKQLGDRYREIRGKADVKIPDAYWQFIKDVKIGDLIVVFCNKVEGKRNHHIIYGWGEITSELINNVESDNPLQRHVEWKKQGLEVEDFSTRNSMFFHSTTIQQADKIKNLLGINIQKSLQSTDMTNIQEYIDLLKENRNLVLTGAPGTGKTYLAKEIAKAMKAEYMFIQFHPSFDYTDFVEGLRPKNEVGIGIGFERKDGIFKAFCKRALIDKVKTNDELQGLNESPRIWKVSLEGTGDNPTRTDCMENGYVRIGWDKYGNQDFDETFNYYDGGKTILKAFQNEMQIGDIVVSCYGEYTTDAIGIITGDYEYKEAGTPYPRYRNVEWIIKNVRLDTKELIGKKMTLSTVYKLAVPLQKMIAFINENTKQETMSAKNYVFIIDEINRGDLSKIFGELFYAIDPSYRGESGRVQTQYQNIIDPSDVFAEGFYVPDNIYIIATMNDIDRSVESMDFAMRRRFVWKEVNPKNRVSMLDQLGNVKDEAIKKMTNLNRVISDRLGHEYQIGPAYFLKRKDGDFQKLWDLSLAPLLREYLRGTRNKDKDFEDFKDAYFA